MNALKVSLEETLPADAAAAALVGRAWLPGPDGGPCVVALRNAELIDLTRHAPTVAGLLARTDRVELVRSATGPSLGRLDDWLASTCEHGPDIAHRHLLAPCDLQVVKAAGVTFVASMLERVIEEQARGDASRAHGIRQSMTAVVGADLASVRPGSDDAAKLKQVLQSQGLWSQYLEVGIGPDAEIFTKAAPMASLGTAMTVGLHPGSHWNNPEPEVVLAVSEAGEIVGASLGNDVNLRDFEGRSALLLGKAKDNNASCAIGPFIRLFDDGFGIADVASAELTMEVHGEDGFVMSGSSSMARISRSPEELVTHAMGPHHQYPDGIMLFCGTMFAPTQDRDAPGQGFTHHEGDRVAIRSARLGGLVNLVGRSDQVPPWRFGIGALMRNLAKRQLLGADA